MIKEHTKWKSLIALCTQGVGGTFPLSRFSGVWARTNRCIEEIFIKLCHQLWQRHSRSGSFYCRAEMLRAGVAVAWRRRTGRAASVFLCVSPNRRVAIRNTTQSDKSVSGMGHGGCLGYFSWLPDWRMLALVLCCISRIKHIHHCQRARRRCVRVSRLSLQVAKIEPLSSPFTNIFPFPLCWCVFLFLSFCWSYIFRCGWSVLLWEQQEIDFPAPCAALCRILFTTDTRGCCCYCGIWKGSCHINCETRSFGMTNFRETLELNKKRCHEDRDC